MAMDSNIFAIIERYWDRAPVDIQSIIRDAGILYSEEPLGPKESGLLDRYFGGYRIVVNIDHPLPRRRFTAAHELGHYVYHRDLIGDGISDAAYRTNDSGRYRNAKIRPRHETEANQFAATVLMPEALINRLSHEENLPIPARIDDLARLLEVSEQALRIRLGYS
jgi:Zn-dependent peptidase ImmA (M78 family)